MQILLRAYFLNRMRFFDILLSLKGVDSQSLFNTLRGSRVAPTAGRRYTILDLVLMPFELNWQPVLTLSRGRCQWHCSHRLIKTWTPPALGSCPPPSKRVPWRASDRVLLRFTTGEERLSSPPSRTGLLGLHLVRRGCDGGMG